MTKSQNPSEIFKEFLASFSIEPKTYEESYRNTAVLNEKLSGVILNAASQSAEISAKWSSDTIEKLAEISKAKSDPNEYAKAVGEYAGAQAEIAAENMVAFADLAKKVQLETVELLVTAGKALGEETSASIKKAADDAMKAAKSASRK